MKRTFKMHLCWRKWRGRDLELELSMHEASSEPSGLWAAGVIGAVDVTVDVPDDFDPRPLKFRRCKWKSNK